MATPAQWRDLARSHDGGNGAGVDDRRSTAGYVSFAYAWILMIRGIVPHAKPGEPVFPANGRPGCIFRMDAKL